MYPPFRPYAFSTGFIPRWFSRTGPLSMACRSMILRKDSCMSAMSFAKKAGLDPTTFLPADFVAFSNRVAMDTISFLVKAPLGYYISKIVYTQRGAASTGRTSVSAGGATWVVAGHAANLGAFRGDPSLAGTADVTALKLTSVPVSVTVSLFASTGAVAVTSADVLVQVVPR